MNVSIRYSGQLAQVAGVVTETLALPERPDLASLLEAMLDGRDARFREMLCADDGGLRVGVILAVDGAQVAAGAVPPLHDGCEVHVLMPVAGG